MSGKLGEKSGEKILQIDIEGGEYPVLIYESPSTLANFSTMIVEFHDFHRLYEKTFLRMVSAVFEKIYENFSICHVHPNNCCGVAELDGISVPRVIEVTFIRNDQLVKYKNGKQIALPHPLDKKNVKENDELLMPEIWWKR